MNTRRSGPEDASPPSAAVYAGAAREDITPPIGIYHRNWGAARQDVASGIHRPLTATALALAGSSDEPPLVLIVLDAGWWQLQSDEWFIRGAVLEALRLGPARVMISCTHTHAGPSLCSADAEKPGGHLIGPYLVTLRDAAVRAAREAIGALAPATLTWAQGRCNLATHRDLPDPRGGRVLCGYNPDGDADDTLLVGRVCDAQGRNIATLVNYACHLTTLAWDNTLISPDWAGAMREVVEAHTGQAPCLFLQGASGELAPREQYVGDPAIADANGRRVGHAAMAVLESMLPPATRLSFAGPVESGAPLALWRREAFEPSSGVSGECIDVELPLKPLPDEQSLRRELDACVDRAMAERIRRRIRVVSSVGPGPTCRMPAWIWRVGDAVFVGQANEAYSAFQKELRRRFPQKALVVMNLVNGAVGYLSPPELHDLDIYQVWQSPFAREALPALIEGCSEAIARQEVARRSGSEREYTA